MYQHIISLIIYKILYIKIKWTHKNGQDCVAWILSIHLNHVQYIYLFYHFAKAPLISLPFTSSDSTWWRG